MTRRSSRDDRTLLKASRTGHGGFDELYRRCRDAVLAFHRRRVADAELAADLAAETFAAALVAVHDRERALPEGPAAWLFVIAQRKLVDSCRRGQVEDAAPRRLELEPLALDDEDIKRIELTAGATDVAAELARRLARDQWEALGARARRARVRGDRRRAGCSPSVVRMRVSRALKTLRTAMEGHDDRRVL